MTMASFADRLDRAIDDKGSLVCLGIDPQLELFPAPLAHLASSTNREVAAAAVQRFADELLDAVSDLVAVKPQVAFFERLGPPGVDGARAPGARGAHARPARDRRRQARRHRLDCRGVRRLPARRRAPERQPARGPARARGRRHDRQPVPRGRQPRAVCATSTAARVSTCWRRPRTRRARPAGSPRRRRQRPASALRATRRRWAARAGEASIGARLPPRSASWSASRTPSRRARCAPRTRQFPSWCPATARGAPAPPRWPALRLARPRRDRQRVAQPAVRLSQRALPGARRGAVGGGHSPRVHRDARRHPRRRAAREMSEISLLQSA